jgi:hypothetical protein
MITKNFNIVLADEPYVDTTALNKTYPATYTGPKYIKVQIDIESGYAEKVIFGTDDLSEMTSFEGYAKEPGKTYTVIDATVNPFEAAYMTGMYDTGVVEDYSEDIGTTDEEGNPETWNYVWEDNRGMISQQYMGLDLKFVSGAWVRPRFRVHALTRESFLASMTVQINAITAALAKADSTLTDADKAKLETYKTWLQNIPTKYAGVKHWKIPFKHQVPQY